jgi:hypothetical protein
VQRALWDLLWFWNIILKGRQHGISSFILLLMLDACLFNANTHCGLIDATLADATKKLDKARLAYEKVPPNIKAFVPMRSDNATCLEWRNGSRSAPAIAATPCKFCTSARWAKSAHRHRHAAAKLEQARSARCTPARPSS